MNIVRERSSLKKEGVRYTPKIIANIREQILEKGKIMLLEGKYIDFNMRNLANNCGLGLGTIYNYFANKDELIYHIFKTEADRTIKLFDDLKREDIPFYEKLKKIYTSLELFIAQYMSIFKEMSGGGIKSCPHNHYTELYSKMQELIENEKMRGRFESDIESLKLAYFYINNIIFCIKDKYMNFEELSKCLNWRSYERHYYCSK